MVNSYSNKVHIAKRDLRTLCNNCYNVIRKDEEYRRNQSINGFRGHYVEHVECPPDELDDDLDIWEQRFINQKK